MNMFSRYKHSKRAKPLLAPFVYSTHSLYSWAFLTHSSHLLYSLNPFMSFPHSLMLLHRWFGIISLCVHTVNVINGCLMAFVIVTGNMLWITNTALEKSIYKPAVWYDLLNEYLLNHCAKSVCMSGDLFLVACYATLHPILLVSRLVGWSVCWSVGRLVG